MLYLRKEGALGQLQCWIKVHYVMAKDAYNYCGVIKNSLFESSYNTDKNYDCFSVLNAGKVFSYSFEVTERKENSISELYKLVYSC